MTGCPAPVNQWNPYDLAVWMGENEGEPSAKENTETGRGQSPC